MCHDAITCWDHWARRSSPATSTLFSHVLALHPTYVQYNSNYYMNRYYFLHWAHRSSPTPPTLFCRALALNPINVQYNCHHDYHYCKNQYSLLITTSTLFCKALALRPTYMQINSNYYNESILLFTFYIQLFILYSLLFFYNLDSFWPRARSRPYGCTIRLAS